MSVATAYWRTGTATSVKTRIIAHQQQVVRVDRETTDELDPASTTQSVRRDRSKLELVRRVIIGDYGKGVITQELLDQVKRLCRARGIWLSWTPSRSTT